MQQNNDNSNNGINIAFDAETRNSSAWDAPGKLIVFVGAGFGRGKLDTLQYLIRQIGNRDATLVVSYEMTEGQIRERLAQAFGEEPLNIIPAENLVKLELIPPQVVPATLGIEHLAHEVVVHKPRSVGITGSKSSILLAALNTLMEREEGDLRTRQSGAAGAEMIIPITCHRLAELPEVIIDGKNSKQQKRYNDQQNRYRSQRHSKGWRK